MDSPSPETLAAILRTALSSELRFRRFMRQLEAPRSDGLVMFWQSRVLDRIEETHSLALPREAAQLLSLLPRLPPRQTLPAESVPTWIQIEALQGQAPVQGWGRAGAWRWYFRSRHEEWSIAAVRNGTELPVGDYQNTPDTFWWTEPYDGAPSDASYMPVDEARYFIVRELTRLADRPDSGIEA